VPCPPFGGRPRLEAPWTCHSRLVGCPRPPASSRHEAAANGSPEIRIPEFEGSPMAENPNCASARAPASTWDTRAWPAGIRAARFRALSAFGVWLSDFARPRPPAGSASQSGNRGHAGRRRRRQRLCWCKAGPCRGKGGTFELTPQTPVVAGPGARAKAQQLAGALAQVTGRRGTCRKAPPASLRLHSELDALLERKLGREGYRSGFRRAAASRSAPRARPGCSTRA